MKKANADALSISVFYSHRIFQSRFGNLKHEHIFIHHVILEKGLV